MRTVYVLLTMDCETARSDLAPNAIRMSGSGPADYKESARSICGYAETAATHGYPVTFLAHPEVAVENADLLLDLQDRGACLGLHVHPYKLRHRKYRYDLGAYSAGEQTRIVSEAMQVWESALGSTPRYFRAGYFSANDQTIGVLNELGFAGGSLSNPGRFLPGHHSLWAGAENYPHRAHHQCRLTAGESNFINVPVSVAFGRPVGRGHAGEQGFEWSYVPHPYDHAAVIRNVLERFVVDKPRFPVIVTDSHNDQEYRDPDHPARLNLGLILRTIMDTCCRMGLRPEGITLDALCRLVLEDAS
ncbi:MAG: hypothetical protein OXH06_08800 [Gemmatimonadetes bacterium]|nr:hypothetical protein [Gemmatimonadota bacterium]MDE3256879.1 hypothetical protein [Gemmatimonadota bacterium]